MVHSIDCRAVPKDSNSRSADDNSIGQQPDNSIRQQPDNSIGQQPDNSIGQSFKKEKGAENELNYINQHLIN
jgi:hypothetical protein